jgi:formate dehydrogenase
LANDLKKMKVLLVLYSGGPHARDEPKLLGCVERKLGVLRKWLEDQGHELVTTSDKDREGSDLDKRIVDAEIVITTPYSPGYITRERIAKAKNLKICITAGVRSDHVDLEAANERKISVIEVTGSEVTSCVVVVMTMLVMVRNFVRGHEQITRGKWDVAAVAKDPYDLEGKVIATVGGGRIDYRVVQRCKPFESKEWAMSDAHYETRKKRVGKACDSCRNVTFPND